MNVIAVLLLNSFLLVSGHPVKSGDFPWIVSLSKVTHFCAGSILDKKFILTAASCVKSKKANKIKVRAGSLEHEKGGQELDIEEVIMHPDYDEKAHINDIALLVVKEEIELGENAKAVKLPEEGHQNQQGTKVAGWQKWGGSKLINNLRFTMIDVFTQEECSKKIGQKFIADKMLCAGIPKVGKGMCKGDVGGPLMINDHQYGVVSWGSGCEPPNEPGVYTDIFHVKEWIQEHLAKKNGHGPDFDS